MEERKTPGVEEALRRLDVITEEMEKEEISLEESFGLFQEGMKLVNQCREQLETVEKKMMILEEEYQS